MTNDNTVPRATYRLQLTAEFPFARAAALAPYLAQLGISHAYLSPVLKARRGSSHGYDTVDHGVLNPELGSQRDFEEMVTAFRRHGLGVIVDIVPNHMGIGGDENELWLDVLRWGPRSRYAEWFDINWSPSEPSLQNKILVPMLGRSFGEAMESGALELRHDADGDFAIWAEGVHKLPVCPETYPLIGGPSAVDRYNSAEGRQDLVRLIDAQHWRPARYSVAADDINYRRFFIVSDLAAIRVERDEVFDHVHSVTFDLVREGLVDGLRVDHIDGLYDPKQYCLRLREAAPRPIYLVVEKILAPHETIRADWQVDGTTGYEFGAAVTRLLTDPRGEAPLTETYERFIGKRLDLAEEERNAKRSIVDFEMAAELDALTDRVRRLAANVPRTSDLTRNTLRSALREVVAAMPVYRTYIDGGPLDQQDARNIAFAVASAREATPALHPAVFDFLSDVLTGELCRVHMAYPPEEVFDVARRIQQFTGPVMAKGLEDTALYRYNRLLALSEVGSKPDRFTTSLAAFHNLMRSRLERVPHGMLTTSSHDTKRGEDLRARVVAISGFADEWAEAVEHWNALLAVAGAPKLESNDVYCFFQLLLGAWPTTLVALDNEGVAALRQRVGAAMLKSVREARLKTNWNVPKSDYEEALAAFVDISVRPGAFIDALLAFERRIATAGAQNGLIQTALKLTVPGVPDIYQGAELWEQSMVDPDNRRPVDYELSMRLLSQTQAAAPQIAGWRSGAIKQRVIADLLAYRAAQPGLFSHGSYEPVEAGPDVVAFVRRHETAAMVVAARLYPWRAAVWDENPLSLPEGISWDGLRRLIGEGSEDEGSLFGSFPIAVFVSV